MIAAAVLIVIALFGSTRCSRKTTPLAKSAEQPPSVRPGSTDQAVELFQQRVQHDPKDFLSYTVLGQLLVRKGRETGQLGCYEQAEAALRRALELRPDHAPAMSLLATACASQHKFAEALRLARQAYETDPARSEALGTIADAYLELGEYSKADEALQRLQRELPDEPPVLARLAHWQQLKGNTAEALRLLQRAADLVHRSSEGGEEAAWYHARLGDLYFSSGRPQEAGEQFEAALKLFDNYPIALAGLGDVRVAQGQDQAAVALYERATATASEPRALAKLGDLYEKSGRRDQARSAYTKLESLCTQPGINESAYRRELARFYADHEIKLSEALRLIRADLSERKDVYGHDLLSWILYKSHRSNEAAESIAEAMKLGTQEADFYYHAGMIQYSLGNATQAKALLRRAIGLSSYPIPDDARRALTQLGGRPDQRETQTLR